MAIAFVFPGQGSQAVGMGAELAKAYPSARAVFDEVDAALGQKLSELMFSGPLETLTLTENAQPALMAVSLAVMRVLESEKGFRLADKVKFVAGHSLGEYSALAAAGAFSIADAARLLRIRGKAMQAAVPVGQGAMAALLGVGKEVGREARRRSRAGRGVPARQRQRADPGRHLGRQDGHRSRRAARQGARRAPLHAAQRQRAVPLRADATGGRRDGRGARQGRRSRRRPCRVVANVLAAPISDPAEIKQRLVEQVTGTVRWRECVVAMADAGVTDIYEIGSGKVLAGLAKRIVPTLNATSIGTPQDIDAALPSLLTR